MKLTIIYPNFNDPFYPNIGLTNLATYINEKTNHKVNILDLSLHKKDWKVYIKKNIKNVDIVGFTSTMGTIFSSLEVARYVKKLEPELPIIIGGIYATCVTKELFDFKEIDYICVGEGELTIEKFLNALESNSDISGINGLWYRKNGVIIENGVSSIIQNLDSLPFNDYDLWDMKKNFKFINHFPIMGSRGCQYNCTFCTQSTMHNIYDKITNFGYHRIRSPNHIIDELEYQINKYSNIKKFQGFLFFDDTFTSNRKFVYDFCNEYRKRKLNDTHHWAINARIENLDFEMLKTLKEAGCYYLYMGLESSSEKTRNLYKKKFKQENMFRKLDLIRKMGFKIKCYFIIDGPQETVNDSLLTLRLVKKIKPDTFHIMPFIPIPRTYGSEMLEKTNPARFKYIREITNMKEDKKIEFTYTLVSVVLGHMPESYKDLLRILLSGLLSTNKKVNIYAKIILNTFKEYIISSIKYGKFKIFKDFMIFLKWVIKYDLVTSDLFALTLKKYLLEDSFKN